MRSSPKPAILALGAAIGLVQALGAPAAPPVAATTTPAAPGASAAPGAAATPGPKKGKKGKKSATPATDPNGTDDSDETKSPLNIPLPKGEPQHAVKFPLYGSDGLLNYRFEMGLATLMDDDMVKMQKLKIVSFKEDPDHVGSRIKDLDMDLPDAFLNQRTKDLTSEAPITIDSDNYHVTGQKMTFNLATRQGTLGGGVKMVIYDMDKLSRGGNTTPTAKTTPTVEIESKKIELKK